MFLMNSRIWFQFVFNKSLKLRLGRKPGRPKGTRRKKQSEIAMLKENAKKLLTGDDIDQKPDLTGCV